MDIHAHQKSRLRQIPAPTGVPGGGASDAQFLLQISLLAGALYVSLVFYLGVVPFSSRIPLGIAAGLIWITGLSGGTPRAFGVPRSLIVLTVYIFVWSFMVAFAYPLQFVTNINIVAYALIIFAVRRHLSELQIVRGLAIGTAFYAFLFYPLAWYLGMIGISSADRMLLESGTSYVGQYFEAINSFVISGSYSPGRGQFGFIGTVLLCIVASGAANLPRLGKVVLIGCGAMATILCDTRGVLLAAPIPLLIFGVLRNRVFMRRVCSAFAIAAFIVSPLVTYTAGRMNWDTVGITWMQRQETSLLNQREAIWPIIWGSFNESPLSLIFGRGELTGQEYVREHFRGLNTAEFGVFDSAHNLSLQILFDYGIVGWSLMLVFFLEMRKVLCRSQQADPYRDLLALLWLFFALYGMTSSIFSLGRFHEVQFCAVLLLSLYLKLWQQALPRKY